MKRVSKNAWLFLCLICAFLAMFSAAACSKAQPGESSESTSSAGVTVVLSESSVTLDLYETVALFVTEGAGGNTVWSSTDDKIASVDGNGVVTALAAGSCLIKAENDNGSAVCSVVVVNSYVSPVIKTNTDDIYLDKNDEYILAPVLMYKGEDCTAEARFEYDLKEEGAANVIETQTEGGVLFITGKEYGSATVVASCEYVGVRVSREISVTVRETGVVFDAPDLTPTAGGYEVVLDTLDNPICVPEITVLKNGEAVADATISYESNDPEIAVVSGGTITAIASGKASVVGTYNGQTFTIIVSVIKPVLSAELDSGYIETGRLKTLSFKNPVIGSYVSATIGKTEVGESMEDGQLTLSGEKCNTLPISMYGDEVVLTVETDRAFYSAPIKVYTLVIRSESDYRMMGTLSKAVYPDDPMQFGGYFILGNSIHVENGLLEFIDRGGAQRNIKNDGTQGFRGVFDGNGYCIDGLKRTGNEGNAFITVLHADGVIRNVGFTNVSYNSEGGSFLVQFGSGTVSDVYVEYTEISASGEWSGTVMNCGTGPEMTVERVFVDASKAQVSGSGVKFHLLFVSASAAKVTDNSLLTVVPEGYDSATMSAMINNYALGQKSFLNFRALKENADVFAKVLTWNIDLWHVDPETGVVTFGTPYVAPVLPETENIEVDETERRRIELDILNSGELNDKAVSLGLDDIASVSEKIGADYVILSVNGEEVEGGVVKASIFGYAYGEQTIEVIAETENKLYDIRLPVLLVSKVIRTVEDYRAWGIIAKACESNSDRYGGYFELGNDISDPSGSIAINAFNTLDNKGGWGTVDGVSGWTGDATKGFAGTFDGCGYVIDGLTSNKTSNLETFIGAMTPEGVLRNIGFTNVSMLGCAGGGNVLLTNTFYGTLENIYVHYKEIVSVGYDGTTASKDGTVAINSALGELKVVRLFVDASAVTCEEGKYGFGILGTEQCINKTTDTYGIFYGNYQRTVSQFTSWTAPASQQGFESYEALKANEDAWAAVQKFAEECEYWHIDESTGKVTFGR